MFLDSEMIVGSNVETPRLKRKEIKVDEARKESQN